MRYAIEPLHVGHYPARQYPAGAYDGTRFVYVFGGLSINPVGGVLFLDDLVQVDSLTGNFTCPALTSSPSGRHSSAMTFHDGQLYLFGGSSISALNDMWTWSPSSDTWSRLTLHICPSPRSGHSAVREGSNWFVFGGATDTRFERDLWVFRLDLGGWECLFSDLESPLTHRSTSGFNSRAPSGRKAAGVAVRNRKLYVVGGEGSCGLNGEVWLFDMASSVWTLLGTGPAVQGCHLSLHGELLLCFGGTGPDLEPLTTIREFNLTTRHWTQTVLEGLSLHNFSLFPEVPGEWVTIKGSTREGENTSLMHRLRWNPQCEPDMITTLGADTDTAGHQLISGGGAPDRPRRMSAVNQPVTDLEVPTPTKGRSRRRRSKSKEPTDERRKWRTVLGWLRHMLWNLQNPVPISSLVHTRPHAFHDRFCGLVIILLAVVVWVFTLMAFRRYDPNEPCVGLVQLLANDRRRDLTLSELWDVATTPEYWLIAWSGLALLVIYRYFRWLTVTKFCTVEAPFTALPQGFSGTKTEGPNCQPPKPE